MRRREARCCAGRGFGEEGLEAWGVRGAVRRKRGRWGSYGAPGGRSGALPAAPTPPGGGVEEL